MTQTKDITDAQVVAACAEAHADRWRYRSSLDVLACATGAPVKVCYRAMERAMGRGFIECGVSLRCAWAEPKGLALLSVKSGG